MTLHAENGKLHSLDAWRDVGSYFSIRLQIRDTTAANFPISTYDISS